MVLLHRNSNNNNNTLVLEPEVSIRQSEYINLYLSYQARLDAKSVDNHSYAVSTRIMNSPRLNPTSFASPGELCASCLKHKAEASFEGYITSSNLQEPESVLQINICQTAQL
jgi:hypothetical protein